MDWQYPSPFTFDLTVDKQDIDGLNHTNNACYVRWCESAAWKHSSSLGLDIADYQRLNRGMALHSAEYQYFLPSFESDQLRVATWLVGSDKKLRLNRHFQINKLSTGQCIMKAEWALICVTVSSGKATRFPKEFLDAYANREFPIGSISE
ncbi:MAG: acyl-CoA thioesterase [Pseudohongiellaceae bacterium]